MFVGATIGRPRATARVARTKYSVTFVVDDKFIVDRFSFQCPAGRAYFWADAFAKQTASGDGVRRPVDALWQK